MGVLALDLIMEMGYSMHPSPIPSKLPLRNPWFCLCIWSGIKRLQRKRIILN